MRNWKRNTAKTKLKIGCPRCGGPVGMESGFHACLNKRCGWHSEQTYLHARYDGGAGEGYYKAANGRWYKNARDIEPELTTLLQPKPKTMHLKGKTK